MYSPLELDEIRLERSRDREGVLASRIEKMKNKLTSMRKSRTEVQTRRDIAASVEEKIDKFNARGREIYGKAWEEGQSGSMPIRELVKIPESDVRAMQMEAQAIVTARKEEEKRDLWGLWNDKADLGSYSSAPRKDNSARLSTADKSTGDRVTPSNLVSTEYNEGVQQKGQSHRKRSAGKSSKSNDRVGDNARPKVKVPSHLMKKYTAVHRNNSHGGSNQNSDLPIISPPPGPPPPSAIRYSKNK